MLDWNTVTVQLTRSADLRREAAQERLYRLSAARQTDVTGLRRRLMVRLGRYMVTCGRFLEARYGSKTETSGGWALHEVR